MAATKQQDKSDKSKKISNEQIIMGFNQLRQDQRNFMSKLSELEDELNEHNLVSEALKDVDGERRCYRMVGGVLVERTVKEVLPAVNLNKEQLAKVIETLNKQVIAKGKELNEYREKHNIQIRGEQGPTTNAKDGEGENAQSSGGILVESNKS